MTNPSFPQYLRGLEKTGITVMGDDVCCGVGRNKDGGRRSRVNGAEALFQLRISEHGVNLT